MEIIRIRPKGQVTLPLFVRQKLQVEEGDYLVCEVEGDRLVLYKMPVYKRASFDDGIWRLIGSAVDREGKNDVSEEKHKYLGEKA
ncbi:MAG: AbrB/MazE/SpoVT family DNA-binding domain-containing protein [Bacillota bacterium]|jgi:AbrB family looped-hinge helix DNA binding protein|nr:AbrB/MazE/SpoVT family DNA-binding domain-containing protein [Thermoanaerobacteraceae bacterium]